MNHPPSKYPDAILTLAEFYPTKFNLVHDGAIQFARSITVFNIWQFLFTYPNLWVKIGAPECPI